MKAALFEYIEVFYKLPNLRVQLPDLPFPGVFSINPEARLKRTRRVVQQLLLPGVDLVRVNLIAHGEISHRRLLPQRLQGVFPFTAASIFRFGFFIICSVHHDGADTAPINTTVPNQGLFTVSASR
ncbi:MAG: hypothetical protein JNM48_04815 [Rhodospirillales bacterium]|nr:hypothetical protein [Rhodospirillales bacterium]